MGYGAVQTDIIDSKSLHYEPFIILRRSTLNNANSWKLILTLSLFNALFHTLTMYYKLI